MAAIRRFLSLAACALLVCASQLNAQQPEPDPAYGARGYVTEWPSQPGPRRVAILGAVEHPGIYESKSRTVTVGELLKTAGGHPSAGEFLIRHHSGLQPSPIWSPNLQEFATDGDLYYVSPARKAGRELPATKAGETIHVGILGLKPDQPVVVRVPGSHRTLALLLSMLKQRAELTTGARVFRNGPNDLESTRWLENGDIIALESALVDRKYLDRCPAILAPISLDAPPAAAAPVPTAELISPRQELVASPALPVAPLLPPLAHDVASDVAASHVAPSSIPAMRITAEAPLETSAHHSERTAARKRAEKHEPAIHANYERPAAAPAGDKTNVESAERSNSLSTAAGTDPLSSRSLILLLAAATSGLGLALLWLASERRLRLAAELHPVAVPVVNETPPETIDDSFQKLVRNELTIEDEPVVVPGQLSLHGQAIGQKRLILHPPEPLAGPHFATTADRPSLEKVTVAAGERSIGERPRATPARSPRETETLLDRVLLAMQREGRQ